MSLYSRLDRIAADVEKLNRQVTAVANSPQSQRTSVEGGSIDFNDADGNLMAIVGGQDDGSNTIRHVDGPTPPVPSGLSAHVDGPIIQVSWDGTFEDADNATYDWSHLEVIAVGPGNEQLTATINDVTGASTSVAATSSGEWTVVARSVSRAEKRSLDGDAGTVTVELVGLSGAINDAIGSANGKNTVHYSEVPPTPADEGVLGDTWFVNQVNPETGTMLITEQWQYVTEWVQTELNHQVIATVDLGKATVGELDGIRIMGQTVRGEQLSGDAIDGKVITGGTYRTTGGTGSWSDAGLFIAKPDGTSMVRFPTDGSPLSLTASDTQIERASIGELDVSNGAVRSGGQFTLASGVTAPPSPPELTTGWLLEAQLPRPAEPSMDWTGLAYWNGLYVRGVNVLGSAGDPYDRIELYNPDGTFNRSISIDLNPRAGVAVIGDIVYTIGPDHNPNNKGKQWCHGFNLNTGARVSRWEFTRFFAPNQKKIAIGVDGSNLLVAGITPSAMLNVMRYNPSTGAQVGSDMAAAFDVGYSTDIHGVAQSGGKIYVSPRGQVREYTVNGSTLTKTAGFAWDNPNWNSGGFAFVNDVPYVVDSGTVYEGSVSASDYTREMCFTWYDGTHETTASPVATIDVGARETVTISLPVRAGLQKRLYSRSAGGSGKWSRSVVPADVTVSPAPVGVAEITPPTTNTFPTAAPAVLKSTNDKFEVKGDGSGHWGNFNVDANGVMSGLIVSRSTTCAVTRAGQTKKFTVQLPPGRFAKPPVVWAQVETSLPEIVHVGIPSVETTNTSFSLYFNRTNLTATPVQWFAMDSE